jgi:hypothetical protein
MVVEKPGAKCEKGEANQRVIGAVVGYFFGNGGVEEKNG